MTRHVPRIFCTQALQTCTRLRLDGGTAHHLLNVLRIKPGDPVTLFDGSGGEYAAEIVEQGRSWVEVLTGQHHETNRESQLLLVLAQGISRGERMDYTIQKAVELGVSTIQPLETERSIVRLDAERQSRKLQHWNEVARSATEQSGRDRVPEVLHSLPLPAWLRMEHTVTTRLLLDPLSGQGLQSIAPARQVCLLVGPEGGLSEAEVALAREAGFTGIRLGPRILRTETAGVAALAALQSLWGDLSG